MSPPDDACLSEDELLRFALGRGDAGTTARVESHVDGCEECRELLAETLRALPPPAPGEAGARSDKNDDGSDDHGGGDDDEAGLVEPNQRLGRRLPPGTVIGRYVIEEPLGAGGMGVVYIARDPQLRRKVALKLLRGDRLGAGDKGQRQARLLREAQAMARLRHENVVVVHDVGPFEDGLFVAMELIEGGNAREWVARERPSWRQVVEVMRAAGEGLCAAHAAGIVHRDFKPDNVLIGRGAGPGGGPGVGTGEPRVCVSDFGIAATERRGPDMPDAHGTTLTVTGMVLGTPGYMAPEQLLGRAVDVRADVYAFCVTLYEALFGRLPGADPDTPPRGTSGSRELSLTSGQPAQAAAARVPRWLRRAVRQGLSTDPSERPRTMRAMLDAIDPRRQARRTATRVVLPSLLAVTVAVGGGAAWLVARQAQGPCDDGARRLDGVWDAGRREAVRRAFVGTGRPHGADLAVAAGRVLDEYAARWESAHRAACEATWVRHAQSEERFAAQARCLGGRLEAVAALVSSWERADVAVMEGAVAAAHGLDDPGACREAPAPPVAAPLVAAPAVVTPPAPAPAPAPATPPAPAPAPAPAPGPGPTATPAANPVDAGVKESRKRTGHGERGGGGGKADDPLKNFDL